MDSLELSGYFAVQVATLSAGQSMPCDLFIHLPLNQRMIRILQRGDVIERNTLDRFSEKQITTIYARNEDKWTWTDAKHNPRSGLAGTPSTPTQEMPADARLVEAVTFNRDVTIPRGEENDVPTPTMAVEKNDVATPTMPAEKSDVATQTMAAKTSDVATPTAGTENRGTESDAEIDDEHATNVAVYALLLTKELNRRDSALLSDVITVSLLHDIGLTQIPVSILSQPVAALTGASLANYVKHVEEGLRLAEDLGMTFSPGAKAMFLQHHEKFNGTGFPAGLQSFAIDEMAQIIGFAVLIDNLCRGRVDGTRKSLPEAMKVIQSIEKQTSFPNYFSPEILKKALRWLKSAKPEHFSAATSEVKIVKDRL